MRPKRQKIKKIETKTCEEDILSYIGKKGLPIQSKIIQKALIKKGHGKATIHRHLTKMSKAREILQLGYPEYKRYGISLENKKVKYYTLPENNEQIIHYNAVIDSLVSENEKEKNNALKEIESSNDINLLPEQLTKLSKTLKSVSFDTCYKILWVIKNHCSNHIFPNDLESFQSDLIECFKKYNKIDEAKILSLTEAILSLLGILENEQVIFFLENEIRQANNMSFVVQKYSGQYECAPVILKNRTRLFRLANNLPDVKSNAIFQIRKNAKEKVGMHESSLKKYKKVLENLKK